MKKNSKTVVVELESLNYQNEVVSSFVIAEFVNLGWASEFIRYICNSELFLLPDDRYKITVNDKIVYVTRDDKYVDIAEQLKP